MRFDTSDAFQTFVDELAKLNVRLPLRVSEEDVGVILDAAGVGILTVDVNGDHCSDLEAVSIAAWIAMAVNTCGGYRAEIRHDG
jgi:hypothetical protein